jgi:hypothetical protein
MARYIGTPSIINNNFENDANFVFSQGVAAAQWVVTHNLGKKCSVTVVDSAGTIIIGQVTYNSDNQCTIDFEAAFSGKAFFN